MSTPPPAQNALTAPLGWDQGLFQVEDDTSSTCLGGSGPEVLMSMETHPVFTMQPNLAAAPPGLFGDCTDYPPEVSEVIAGDSGVPAGPPQIEGESPLQAEIDTKARDDAVALNPLALKKLEKFTEIFAKGLEEFTQSGDDESALCNLARGGNGAEMLGRATLVALDEYCAGRAMNSRLQRQKFHELFQNLKRDNNKELRLKIVRGEIPIEQLVRMDAKDLAPESLKRKRESEAEKYFKQHVILQQDPKASIIRKTHKGLEEVQASSVVRELPEVKTVTPPPEPRGNEGAPMPTEDTTRPLIEQPLRVPWVDAGRFPESNPVVEPSPKRARLGASDAITTQQRSNNSTTTATQLAEYLGWPAPTAPWQQLSDGRPEALFKLRISQAPLDPCGMCLQPVIDRLKSRLEQAQDQCPHDQRNGNSQKLKQLLKVLDDHVTGLRRSMQLDFLDAVSPSTQASVPTASSLVGHP